MARPSDTRLAGSYECSTSAPTCGRAGLSPNAHVAGTVPAAHTLIQEITMASSNQGNQGGSKGGKAAHEKGTAHEFTSEEAREAGRKGGEASGGGHRGGKG